METDVWAGVSLALLQPLLCRAPTAVLPVALLCYLLRCCVCTFLRKTATAAACYAACIARMLCFSFSLFLVQ